MKTYIIVVIITLVAFIACNTVAISGRQQLNLIPDATMNATSFQQYDEFLKTHPISKDKKNTALVKKVGKNIQHAVEHYFKERKLQKELNGYKWEFNLVESPEVNAWCMPGGKVVVYTGILPITKDDNGLAVVMGHEIAHAVAKHGAERMSQQLLTQMGGMALTQALADKPAETQQLWMTAFGVGAQYGVLLPFSRAQESEADHLGLIFMAMAGYNPEGAVAFWQRMAAMSGGQKPPELLSTHPSDQHRINDLKKWLPDAMKYYSKK